MGVLRSFGQATAGTVGYILTLMIASVPGAVALFGLYRSPGDLAYSVAATSVLTPVIFLVTWWFLRRDRETFADIGLAIERRSATNWVAGFGLGAVSVGLLVGAPFIVGWAEIRLPAAALEIRALALWTLFFAFQSMGEEVICRGYLLRLWTKHLNLPTGLLISSLLFSVGHFSNDGFNFLAFSNTFLAGVVLGLVYARTGSLWLAGGLHAGWNLALPLFGLNLSGWPIPFAAFQTYFTGSELWSGGQYGPEASLYSTILEACLAIVTATAGRLKLQLNPIRRS